MRRLLQLLSFFFAINTPSIIGIYIKEGLFMIIYFIIGLFICICRFIIFMYMSSKNYKMTNKHLLLTKKGWRCMLSNIICDTLLWPLNVLCSIMMYYYGKKYDEEINKELIIEE